MRTNNAYDLGLFESGAAPRRDPRRDRKEPPKPKLVRRPAPTAEQMRAHQKAAFRQTMKIFSVSALVMLLFAARLYGNARLDELNHEYADLQEQLNIASSENTRLSMELQSRVSLDRVEEYATNVLGMVKQGSYQIEYVDLAGEDGVVIAGGEEAADSSDNSSQSIIEKIKSYLK